MRWRRVCDASIDPMSQFESVFELDASLLLLVEMLMYETLYDRITEIFGIVTL